MKTLTVFLSLVLAACSQAPDPTALASVNGQDIREVDVEAMLSRFSDSARQQASADVRQNILESLVSARALADLAEKGLAAEEVEKIGALARLHRDELLVAAWLEKRRDDIVVTNDMIRKYYHEHSDEFSLGREVHIQYLRVSGGDEAQRNAVLKAVSEFPVDHDWRKPARRLDEGAVSVTIHEATMQESLLDQALRSTVSGMVGGEASGVIFGTPAYRVRLVDARELGVKPLSEVSASIRKRLLPTQIKKIVEEESEKALAQSDVKYY